MRRPLSNLIVALGYCAASVAAAAEPYKVIDGDTLVVDGVRWRLVGIDAPEITHAKCPAERALGLRAKARLEQLLAGSAWSLVARPGQVDRYGRLLGVLMLNGSHVGWTLIDEGLARLYYGGKREGWCG